MSKLFSLQVAASLHDVAHMLDFKPAALSYILYKKSSEEKYATFEIPKRSGGTRKICSPTPSLKLLQRRLADILQGCIEEINEKNNIGDGRARPDNTSHAFKRKRSIITNAKKHRRKKYVFNLDLEDFFGTINFGRVRGFFISNREFSLDPKVATVLAQIICHENSLPQGSPCSPVVSNLIGHILDIRLNKLARKNKCVYTRYADDLTFSTNVNEFPPGIGLPSESDPNKWQVGEDLLREIESARFKINKKKTRMQCNKTRQEVTGLVVNKKINIRSEYRKTVRAMVHRLFTTGEFYINKVVLSEGSGTKIENIKGTLEQLHGMLGFVDSVDLYNKNTDSCNKRASSKEEGLSSKELMYRRFLMFKEFYAAESPIVICEGKTDNVYLTHAIRSLAKEYPQLADVSAEGEISINLRRYRYAGSSTGRILGINGGAPNLSKFIHNYKDDVKRFKAPNAMRHPVIILVDNDSGAGPVFSAVKSITHAKPSREDEFMHVYKNLFLVTTPITGGRKESMIEDFFDKKTREIKLGGKEFSHSNSYDRKTQYGKADFAYKVIEPRASEIDFSGFKMLLNRFVHVIDAYNKMIKK